MRKVVTGSPSNGLWWLLDDVCLQIAAHRLGSEVHYDFGMRTLKSVLLIAAQLRMAGSGCMLTANEESALLRTALLRCNMSKLKAQDDQVGKAQDNQEETSLPGLLVKSARAHTHTHTPLHLSVFC